MATWRMHGRKSRHTTNAMNNPAVCCVMLTADRPEHARRAVEAFRAQTYPAKRLYVYDSGASPSVEALPDLYPEHGIIYHRTYGSRPIGHLRNAANEWACLGDGILDILIHWDDDDWSHPNRIAEQVELLQSSGADAVGYSQMLFWREPEHHCGVHGTRFHGHIPIDRGGQDCDLTRPDCHSYSRPPEAWLYTGDILGTSLCYWRRTWESDMFSAAFQGEATEFLDRIRSAGGFFYAESSIPKVIDGWPMHWHWASPYKTPAEALRAGARAHREPQALMMARPDDQTKEIHLRMIRRIHAGNAESFDLHNEKNCRRAPGWDAYCQGVMA